MVSSPFHRHIQVGSAIQLLDVNKAKEFGRFVELWTAMFPCHHGFANTYAVGLAFDYRELDEPTFKSLQQGLKSLEIRELNLMVPLGLPTSWISIAQLIPESITRLRLKDCFLAVSYLPEIGISE